MTKLILLLSVVFMFNTTRAQTKEDALIDLLGKIILNDTIRTSMLIETGDSTFAMKFVTPDKDEFGVVEYEYENILVEFNVGSELVFTGKPYGEFVVFDISKKSAEITVKIKGAGDRKKQGKCTQVNFHFQNHKYRWLLKGVHYKD